MDTYVASFNARCVFEMEYRLRRADGDIRWILDRGTPRYLPDGDFAGFIGSCIDITDRKAAEVHLVKAVRDRDDFFSIASHELRHLSPRCNSSSAASLARSERTRSTNPRSKLCRSATIAGNQVQRLISLVEELLDVSRLANGRLSLQTEPFDLASLVTDTLRRMRPTLEAAKCPLALEANEPLIGFWDRSRIEQVVTNLVSNATKYGAQAPVDVQVTEKTGMPAFG